MRFLRVSTPYREYLKQFYAGHPELARRGYAEQQRELLADGFQQIDSYGFYLGRLGYQCEEIIANAAPLQRAWCREHGVPWQDQDFDWHTTLVRASRFRPEVVLLANARRFDCSWITALRAACPTVRCVIGWWGVDIQAAKQISGLDLVLTCNEELANQMARLGGKVELLPFGFDPRILEALDLASPPSIEVSFAGSVRRGDAFHARRARLLERISDRFDLQVFTRDRALPALVTAGCRAALVTCRLLRCMGAREPLLTRLPGIGMAARWRSCPGETQPHPLWRRVRPPVYGLKYFQTLRTTGISLNIHPECAGEAAGNLRLFEATGVGTCLLTDWKRDLHRFFELDREVIAFRSDAECLEKLEWLLGHGTVRDAVAIAGQKRTLAEHHFSALAEGLDAIIRKSL